MIFLSNPVTLFSLPVFLQPWRGGNWGLEGISASKPDRIHIFVIVVTTTENYFSSA